MLAALGDVAVAAGGVNTGGAYAQQGAQAYSHDFEREADHVGPYAMALAGLPLDDAPTVWRHMAQADPSSIGLAYSHPTTAERFVRMREIIEEIRRQREAGKPLRLPQDLRRARWKPQSATRVAVGAPRTPSCSRPRWPFETRCTTCRGTSDIPMLPPLPPSYCLPGQTPEWHAGIPVDPLCDYYIARYTVIHPVGREPPVPPKARVIRSFADRATKAVFNDERTTRAHRVCPPDVWRQARRKLAILHAADSLEDLRVPPGNRLEALKGEREGQHSIRINRQYRICFRWTNGNAESVEITDYHG